MLTLLRRMLPLLGVLVLIGAIYDGWIFYGRWRWGQEAARARADAEAERDRKTIDAIGGGGFGIRGFYASPRAIRRGEAASLCYSVLGATRLSLDPPVAEVYPTFTHCIQASPRKDTEFTLTATDAAGHTDTAKLVLKVDR